MDGVHNVSNGVCGSQLTRSRRQELVIGQYVFIQLSMRRRDSSSRLFGDANDSVFLQGKLEGSILMTKRRVGMLEEIT